MSTNYIDLEDDLLSQEDNFQDSRFSDQENKRLEEPQDENTQTPNIYTELTFETWEHVKKWFDMFALQQGFSYKIRRSELDNGIVRRLTYDCSKSGKYDAQVTVDPTKCRSTSSQRIECPWRVNLSFPKSKQEYNDNNERLDIGYRELEYDASQILFSSLIEDVSVEQII
ncbi:10827_t:CDS:2 [Scutellospora calospora]|uniref:10827_t:CDS:1 n=1 Tax=Scutellospora calospora TaxID=85575 RepID=A0ACA9JW95_9GLOM|nr:10827_t:CDS:2 [Scutellospora calospora]